MSGRVKSNLGLLIEAWRDRRAGLLRLLRRDPQHEEAWIWRIHSRVLRFMLRRYSGHVLLNPFAGYTGPDPRLALDRPFGAPPRTREAIRVILERIAYRVHPLD